MIGRTLLLALVLAGCSRSEPEAPPQPRAAETPALRPQRLPRPAAQPQPSPAPTVTPTPIAPLPAAPEPDTSAQMLDDASVAGMTARAKRDEEPVTQAAPLNAEAP